MSGCPDCTPTKLCKWHKRRAEAKQPKPLRRTPLKKKVYKIKPRSTKRAKQENIYNKRAKAWKIENPECKGNIPGCTGETTEVHHKKGKENELLLNEQYWLPLCANCHRIINVMPIEEAIERGFSLRRNVEISKRN